MALNLDFCFADDAALIVAGWSSDHWLDLELHVDDTSRAPRLITRHARRDLRTAEKFGVLAVFDLDGLDLSGGTVHVKSGHDFTEIHPERLITDQLRLVEIGVDELFFAWLRLLAAGELANPQGDLAQAAVARLRFAPMLPRESDEFGLGLDRCLIDSAGQGLVSGWFLPAVAQTEPLMALAMDDQQICRVELFAGALPRADLAPYGSRYRFTGEDGYCGGVLLRQPMRGAVKLLFLVPGQEGAAGVLAPAAPLPAGDFAAELCQVQLDLPVPALRARLRAAMLGPMPVLQPPAQATRLRGTGPVLLLLDHDLNDTDLRDVLRRIGGQMARPVELFLLRNTLSAPVTEAIEGAARELPQGLRLRGAAASLDPTTPLAETLLFGRSSTLFQLPAMAGVFQTPKKPFQISVLDSIGTLTGTNDDVTARFQRDLLPFALFGPTSAVRGMLAQAPRAFLTEEARLRHIAERLLHSGSASADTLPGTLHFVGRSGPCARLLPGGMDLHLYDAESRKLMEALAA